MAMHLVQVLVPRIDGQGRSYPPDAFATIRDELLKEFGGVTTFMRPPATGLWTDTQGTMVRDEVVIFEVMPPQLDRHWWATYRTALCARLTQDELVIRAHEIERL